MGRVRRGGFLGGMLFEKIDISFAITFIFFVFESTFFQIFLKLVLKYGVKNKYFLKDKKSIVK